MLQYLFVWSAFNMTLVPNLDNLDILIDYYKYVFYGRHYYDKYCTNHYTKYRSVNHVLLIRVFKHCSLIMCKSLPR